MPTALIIAQMLDMALARATQISALMRTAAQRGTPITKAELDGLAAQDDAARASLQAEIDRQRSGG